MLVARYMAAPQRHRVCNRPGLPFCDEACNRILVATSLLKTTVLYTEARDKGL